MNNHEKMDCRRRKIIVVVLISLQCFFAITKFSAQCKPIAVSDISVGCAPLNIQLMCTNLSSGNAIWTVGTLTYSGITTPLLLPLPGNYSIVLTTTVNGPNGPCIGSDTIVVYVYTGSA